jgi:hypothetical protein
LEINVPEIHPECSLGPPVTRHSLKKVLEHHLLQSKFLEDTGVGMYEKMASTFALQKYDELVG